MRVVVLAAEEPNQTALCWKLAAQCELAGIILSRNLTRCPPAQQGRRLLNRVEGRLVGFPFVAAAASMHHRYRASSPRVPAVETIRVRHVNDGGVLRFLQRAAPDVVAVSGTNLVGDPIIEWTSRRRGIVNLHTGLSPYVKGGPNCTNWCLAERTFHLIGNTVMWLDAGIDSGPIIATEQTALTGLETLAELHWRVMEHAQDLYVRVIRALAEGRHVPRVPQASLAAGRTFYNIEWNGRAMRRAWMNFKRYYSSEALTGEPYRVESSRLTLYPFSAQQGGSEATPPTAGSARTMAGTLQ